MALSARAPLGLLLVLVGACSLSPQGPCAECPSGSGGQTCWREVVCADAGAPDAGCVLADVACVDRCAADGGCPTEGHVCEPHRGEDLCGPICFDAFCASGKECSSASGACLAVQCGRAVPCGDPTTFCDLPTRTCFPLSGACTDVGDCPTVPRYLDLVCEQQFCSVRPLAQPSVGQMAPETVGVVSPQPGEAFVSQEEVVFTWRGAQKPSIVLVLTSVESTDVLRAAVWGAAVKGDVSQVGLADGVQILDGGWGAASRALPTDVPLYLFVQQVEGAEFLAKSRPVPFMVGAGWARPGDACEGASCTSPAASMLCVNGTCRTACASHRDCASLGGLCTARRVCE